jgi:hypothetical protein
MADIEREKMVTPRIVPPSCVATTAWRALCASAALRGIMKAERPWRSRALRTGVPDPVITAGGVPCGKTNAAVGALTDCARLWSCHK